MQQTHHNASCANQSGSVLRRVVDHMDKAYPAGHPFTFAATLSVGEPGFPCVKKAQTGNLAAASANENLLALIGNCR